MTTLREAAQQALEALELYQSKSSVQMFDYAVKALRAALAEPVQKPVAWLAPDGRVRKTPAAKSFREWEWGPNDFKPLYTAPPQRKPLTEDEIQQLLSKYERNYDMVNFARAIEKAHGIGDNI